ncbi:MAG: hypothetical protein Q8922_06910 [Bacteroidota bacterium]|nr:hypothetical protein [Bacteroidota bacterium]MDP4234046.1 hypothetical protein [Bacteroidota bacterium]MDP4242912.1 hypothetical protein [Bacteroidota bacterium]MDP4287649.1 hypothetical protein [Bacteroidota bacterium]
MKPHNILRIGMMGLVALIAFSVTSLVHAKAINAYLIFKDSTGKETRVAINGDGTFMTPPLQAGTYRWSFGTSRPSTTGPGSSGRTSLPSGGESPKESVAFTITVTPQIQHPRDVASGLPTGKRMHKPIVVMKMLDRSSPTVIQADLGTIIIDLNGDAVTGSIVTHTREGKTMAMDDWIAK